MDQDRRYAEWRERGGIASIVTAVAFALLLPGGWYASGKPLPAPLSVLGLVGAAIGFAVGKLITIVLVSGSGRAAQGVYMPGRSGFYANEHSEIDALEARGDYRGAAAAWEAVSVAEPGNAWPLVRAGELYMRELCDPATAVERFRLARSLPDVKPELERYASQKVIDLLLGPLNERGKAMGELRMLIDRHPASREAEGARDALRRLKAERAEPG